MGEGLKVELFINSVRCNWVLGSIFFLLRLAIGVGPAGLNLQLVFLGQLGRFKPSQNYGKL